MIKRVFEGFAFGAGFAISFVVITYAFSYYVAPRLISAELQRSIDETPQVGSKEEGLSVPPGFEDLAGDGVPFHDLDLERQIERSSAIAVAEYEEADDGQFKAVISEFLKKEPGTTIYYDVGDEYPSASYFPTENTSYGDGVVIFFVGSPATMRRSITYSGERILGLGDMPMKLLREKCEDSATSDGAGKNETT